MWSFGIYDTMTGQPLLGVTPSAGSWRAACTSVGQGQHTFQLRDAETALPRAVAQDLFRPWGRTLAVLWDGSPVYAGIIQRSDYDQPTGALTVQHKEARHIFTKRHLFMLNDYNPGAALVVAGKSMRGLVQAVVRAGAWRPEAGPWNLPLQFPADEAGAVAKTWFHYQWMKVEDMLSEVEGMQGAPDFYMQPRLNSSGWLFWEVRIGTPRIPGATIDLPLAAEKSPVTGLKETRDGSKQVTGVVMIGTGSEQDIRVGKSNNAAPVDPIPYLDDSRTSKQTDSVAELVSLATADANQHVNPIVQRNFSLTHDAENLFALSDVIPGARLRMDVRGDEWMDDGVTTYYALGVSGDMSMTVTPEVQVL